MSKQKRKPKRKKPVSANRAKKKKISRKAAKRSHAKKVKKSGAKTATKKRKAATRKTKAKPPRKKRVVKKKAIAVADAGGAPPRELSGVAWVQRFPNSNKVEDLRDPFRERAIRFIDALVTALAQHHVASTFRPPQRAYLMHWSFRIAREGQDPRTVPAIAGVDIEWWHGDLAPSVNAAAEMVAAYGIVHRPALNSNHTRGHAIDMNVSWNGTLRIYDGNHNIVEIASNPKTHMNTDLHNVSQTYGVIKLVTDPPHWSVDGH